MPGNPRVTFILQNSAFDITVYGLVPFTRHYVYFERQKQADAACAPKGGSKGQALISDTNGKIDFTFYYDAGLPAQTNSLEAAQSMANAKAGVKEVIIASVSQTTFDQAALKSCLSYAKTQIQVEVLAPEMITLTETVYTQQFAQTWGWNLGS